MVGAIGPTAVPAPSDPRLHNAAREFEALLLSDLMKLGSQDEGSGKEDQSCHGYDDLRNQAFATALAGNGGIGIARMLEQKLGNGGGIKDFSFSADSSIAGIFKGDATK